MWWCTEKLIAVTLVSSGLLQSPALRMEEADLSASTSGSETVKSMTQTGNRDRLPSKYKGHLLLQLNSASVLQTMVNNSNLQASKAIPRLATSQEIYIFVTGGCQQVWAKVLVYFEGTFLQ